MAYSFLFSMTHVVLVAHIWVCTTIHMQYKYVHLIQKLYVCIQ